MFLKNKKTVGEIGEGCAVKFLKKNGYKIIERNWYNKTGKRLGEIDIIAKKDEKLVFVEVKTREIGKKSDVIPEEQITPIKLQKLQRASECYIKESDLWESEWQFDAVSVYMSDGNVFKIDHIENIFF